MKNILPIAFLIATIVFLIATIIALILNATTLGGIFGTGFLLFGYGTSKMMHRIPKLGNKNK